MIVELKKAKIKKGLLEYGESVLLVTAALIGMGIADSAFNDLVKGRDKEDE